MFFDIKSLFASALLATTSFVVTSATPVESRNSCTFLNYGQYIITSAETGWQLRPYHHSHAPPALVTYEEPPSGQLGVWTLSPAPQNSYFLRNVGENLPVATLDYGGAPQPYTAPESVGAFAFAIQCAGNGTYVIKRPTEDAVWTAAPGQWVKLFGANGDITQRFRFQAV